MSGSISNTFLYHTEKPLIQLSYWKMNSKDVQQSTQEATVNTNIKNIQLIKYGKVFLFMFTENS